MSGELKRVTLRDIARSTGVSVNTVSRALRNGSDLSAETKARIRAAAERMGYVANDIAGALRSGKTNTLALIISDITNPFFSILAKEVENIASEWQYTVFIMNTEEDEARENAAVRAAISKHVDGVLLIPTQRARLPLELLDRAGVRYVLMGRAFAEYPADCVLFEDETGGYLAASHLLAQGYRRMLMLNAPEHIYSAQARRRGFLTACREAGLAEDPALYRVVGSMLGGCEEALACVRAQGVDAVFAFNDLLAFETVRTLQAQGLRVPRDIGVIGFDDVQSKIPFVFPLTTIHTPKTRMAERAMALLRSRICESGPAEPQCIRLPVHLVSRGSTAPRG